jgi:hypothetical protein
MQRKRAQASSPTFTGHLHELRTSRLTNRRRVVTSHSELPSCQPLLAQMSLVGSLAKPLLYRHVISVCLLVESGGD